MQSLHKHKKNRVAYFVLGIGVIVVIWNPADIFRPLFDRVRDILVPVAYVGSHAGQQFTDSFSLVADIGSMKNTNNALQSRLAELEVVSADNETLLRENTLLREQLALPQTSERVHLGADVVARDVLGGDQWIIVNRGMRDGVHVGSIVVWGVDTFIGRVVDVSDTTARVELITNSQLRIPVEEARTGTEALAEGAFGLSLTVVQIALDAELAVGDSFMTAQIGTTDIPAGLLVGTIGKIGLARDELTQQATLILPHDVRHLRFVQIIK